MPQSRFSVVTSADEVTIRYDGNDVLHWEQGEWEEDPTVVIAIVNAIQQAYERPSELYDYCAAHNLFDGDGDDLEEEELDLQDENPEAVDDRTYEYYGDGGVTPTGCLFVIEDDSDLKEIILKCVKGDDEGQWRDDDTIGVTTDEFKAWFKPTE